MMRLAGLGILVLLLPRVSFTKTVIFWQDHFPAVATQGIARDALPQDAAYIDVEKLAKDGLPADTDLLIMPYGSAFALETWGNIHAYLNRGGNLLVIGGQPFRVPVTQENGSFVLGTPQDAYSREIGILHSYAAPAQNARDFVWRKGYTFLPKLSLQPEKSFVLEGRGLNGLGYMIDDAGENVSAPVAVMDRFNSRYVFLDFEAATTYWSSTDGKALIRTTARYASQGPVNLNIELQFSTLKPGEAPMIDVHLRTHQPSSGVIKLDLLGPQNKTLDSRTVPCSGTTFDSSFDLSNTLPPGFYRLQAVWQTEGETKAFYENGFWVEDKTQLQSGPTLGANKDTLTEDGKPFFPAGANYFSTESNGWDFSGPRNAAVWEDDFAAMEKNNVTFVRTGVWGGQLRIIEGGLGEVSERFLRNVEAYLLCAHQHHVAVNFTFFAFDPQSTMRMGESNPLTSLPGTNPYLDPVTINAEQRYMLSIVNRFKDVPYLSWDLINEPSFSNPRALWHGNTPNDDPAELSAWHAWLKEQYATVQQLAAAWSVPLDQFAAFNDVPLPPASDLAPDLEHNGGAMVRASDYNLFAQESFTAWVAKMIAAIRSAGSNQLINVGQDEGGVENRVLNQFYARAGVSFTTNHTYRQNQNLLWDSWASKVPGVPNIVGETGYQPVTYPSGDWHFDELTGASLIESKWAAGFAAGTTGFLPWDWDREIYFGLLRSDGSSKIWIDTLRRMGDFARQASPYATAIVPPEVAVVLPQSLQLSVLNRYAMEAQQKSFLALYGYDRSQSYAVGEDQIKFLGHPKLIILPSPWVLNSDTWDALLTAVRDGATLLVSGPFDQDPHFLHTGRARQIGLPYTTTLLQTVQNRFQWPGGTLELTYRENKTDVLQRASLQNGADFAEVKLGAGKVLFSPMPLELNDNMDAIANVYRYALKAAHVDPVYTSAHQDSSILICPTRFPDATLYVISSLTDATGVSFRDEASGHEFSEDLTPGRSSILLIGKDGRILASYNWHSN